MNSVLNWAINKVSRELCIDKKIVEAVYKSYWKFIKQNIEALSLEGLTKEECNTLPTNFNLPHLGKLYMEYDKIDKYKRKEKFIKNVETKENKADRESGSGD
jgi:hypothetical protein